MIDLSSIQDLAKQMEDAYSSGTTAMNQAGKQVAADMDPDHQIKVSIQLDATIESHQYSVDADIVFGIELNPILQAAQSGSGDLSSVLDGLDVDLGDDKDAVMAQLGQPRAVGVVRKITTNKLEISDKNGKSKAKLNKDAILLATIKDNKIQINFEGVFSYPDQPDLFIAIPSMEKMQKNIVVDLSKLSKKVEFSWTEKDKDNLKISGDLTISKL